MIFEWLGKMWRPVVEIIILAVCIYYAFNFLKRTRGWPVVIGFFVLLALTIVTTLFQFEVLSWLLQAFFAFSAFAILVIFQPEFRRLLAEIGKVQLFTSTQEKREDIEVIIQTAERLVEVRIGALIAMEQNVPLPEMVEVGIVVDCEATPEMLETIFFPNNAIHDGGVLIKDGRITHAACIFPFTQRQDLSKSMGTRHRAAIGLSEETDAVVVVLSEETGQISVAHKGELTRNISLEQLRLFLTAVFIKRQARRTWFKAVRLWLAMRRKSRPETNGPTEVS